MKQIVIDTKTKKESMDIDTYARWLCLVEAIGYIANLAKRKKISMDDSKFLIKPKPIQKYIKERFPSMAYECKTINN